jgi:lysophospholipase L1-like esterase
VGTYPLIHSSSNKINLTFIRRHGEGGEDSLFCPASPLGTNDVTQQDELANAPKRLGSLIDLLVTNAPDALIVVAKFTPLASGGNAVQTYNAAIRAIVDARVATGKHVLLVDMFTGFSTSMLGDGVHPNQQGYERMAGVW